MEQTESRSTLFINFAGGPGLGKSSCSAGVFFALKCLSLQAEYVSEYAKDLVWAGRDKDLLCQPYVTGKQFYKQYRVLGQVDIAVVDSPIILGVAYGGFGTTPAWQQACLEHFNLFNNLNIILTRSVKHHPYSENGRQQNFEEAIQKDKEIEELFHFSNIPYFKVAEMPLPDIVEAVTALALYTRFKKPGEVYYGISSGLGRDEVFYAFTDKEEDVELILEQLATQEPDIEEFQVVAFNEFEEE
jgi:hypothetical protein